MTYFLGELRIDQVVESVVRGFDPFKFYPDCTEAALASIRAELTPHQLDPDTGNLVLPIQTYVVRTKHHTILIDSCGGEHKDRPKRPFWHQKTETGYLQKLAAQGVTPEQVDYVFCTHLHVDHAGWNTQLIDGRWVPTFPNAKYVFAQEEYTYWKSKSAEDPKAYDHGTFLDSVLPVVEAQQAVLVDCDFALDDQIKLAPTPGHTPGHVAINMTSHGAQGVMSGDLMHSLLQCHYPDWSSMACTNPVQSRATRRQFLERYCDTDTLILTAHFPLPSVGHVRAAGDSFRFEFVTGQS